MAKLKVGLKEISKRELYPDGDYTFRIDTVRATRDGTGEGANLIIIKAPDDELIGKRSYLYLMNTETEQFIGLSQLLASLQLLEVPDGEHGEGDTHNLEGLEFDGTITEGLDKKSGGRRNYVNPTYDADWLDEVRNASDDEIGKRLTKKTRKKTSRRA